MRKQLHEIEDIDNYIFKKVSGSQRLLFEAKTIINPDLRTNVIFQRKTYSLIRWFSRKQRKEQLESVFTRLMQEQHFSSTVNSIFK